MYDTAISEYGDALRIGPINGDTINDLGVLLIKTGRVNSAIRLFEEAIEVDQITPSIIATWGMRTGKSICRTRQRLNTIWQNA